MSKNTLRIRYENNSLGWWDERGMARIFRRGEKN
jgi:hypothetical protein